MKIDEIGAVSQISPPKSMESNVKDLYTKYMAIYSSAGAKLWAQKEASDDTIGGNLSYW